MTDKQKRYYDLAEQYLEIRDIVLMSYKGKELDELAIKMLRYINELIQEIEGV